MVQEPGLAELKMKTYDLNGTLSLLFSDVSPTNHMWAQIIYAKNGLKNLAIHIHSPKDINGAGWDHGKLGRGQTQVLEEE